MFLYIVLSIVLAILAGIRYYLSPPTRWCRSQRCLVGKNVLITGGNTGLGYETALDLAKRGARVIIACRDRTKAEEARRKIIEETDNSEIFVKIVDMASFKSVRAFAKEMNETENRLDILINNAGMSFGYEEKTEDGHDVVMQVNYYSHFLVTLLLIGLMKKSGDPSRIVNVSSLAAKHARNFDLNKLLEDAGNIDKYANSKLCNIFFTKELARRLQKTKVTTYSLHPGAIKTGIFRKAKGLHKLALHIVETLFYKSLDEGTQTMIYCSVEKNIEKYSGDHFDNCKRVGTYKTASIPGVPRRLWEMTEKIVKLEPHEMKEDF